MGNVSPMDYSVNHFQISLCAAEPVGSIALCAALDFAGDTNDTAPEWVHLLAAGDMRTGDGRGPYRIRNATALLTKSLQAGERLVIDENHSTDLLAPKGLPAPARGWIVGLENRADGIWGKVEWTEEGRRMVAKREYRGISPVIVHDKAGNIDAVLRASLVNKPNLKGLVTLHSEEPSMTLLEKLLAALKLPTDTSEDTLVTAITTMHAQQGEHQVALQAQLDPVAEAAGLGKGVKVDAVIAAIKQLATDNADGATIVALQAEVKDLGTQLLALQDGGKRTAAETFVDAAIAAGRVGVKPLRDHYISRHMSDAAGVELELNGLPALGGRLLTNVPPGGKDKSGQRVLTPEQEGVISRMSLDRAAYIRTLDAQELAEAAL